MDRTTERASAENTEGAMTPFQYLLTMLSEECAEITQAASKTMRFGLSSHHPDKPKETNEVHLLEEYYQLQTVMELLQENEYVAKPDPVWVQQVKGEKVRKIDHYMGVSRSKKTLAGNGDAAEKKYILISGSNMDDHVSMQSYPSLEQARAVMKYRFDTVVQDARYDNAGMEITHAFACSQDIMHHWDIFEIGL